MENANSKARDCKLHIMMKTKSCEEEAKCKEEKEEKEEECKKKEEEYKDFDKDSCKQKVSAEQYQARY